MSASRAVPHVVVGSHLEYRREFLTHALSAPYHDLAFTDDPQPDAQPRDEIGRCAANLYYLYATRELVRGDNADSRRRIWLIRECIRGERDIWRENYRRLPVAFSKRGRANAG